MYKHEKLDHLPGGFKMNNPTFTLIPMSKKDQYQNQYQELLDLFSPSSDSSLSSDTQNPLTSLDLSEREYSPVKKTAQRAQVVSTVVKRPHSPTPVSPRPSPQNESSSTPCLLYTSPSPRD